MLWLLQWFTNVFTIAPRRARQAPRTSRPKKKQAVEDRSQSGRARRAPDRYGDESEEEGDYNAMYPITPAPSLPLFYLMHISEESDSDYGTSSRKRRAKSATRAIKISMS